ncbi:MAG TPA: sigma-70 family RNA polymerase sigma factor [Usitatibacter sp.]|nr:sigma-70 family RNA polymerase sigma factor [Usitatibacter sp.]
MLSYAGGDARAFEALYVRHKGPLYRFVLRSVKSAGEAEELAQEIWIKVIGARAGYEPRAKFTTWLFSIAHNRLVDHWRARGLALVSLDDPDDDPPEPAAGPEAEPERVLEAAQAGARLAAALAALPFAQREAFLLHQEGGLTAAQIARATGTNEEAAKSRLRYAMKKLREAIADG